MDNKKRRLALALLFIGSCAAAPASAHHSYTRFDLSKSLTLEGTIKEFQWTNPHVWIQLVVVDPASGKEVEWSIETDSPNMLARRGWTRKLFKPGDRAVAIVHPEKRKSDDNAAALNTITVNGKRIDSLAITTVGGAAP